MAAFRAFRAFRGPRYRHLRSATAAAGAGPDRIQEDWELFFQYHKVSQAFDFEELSVVAGDGVVFDFGRMRYGASQDPAGFLFRVTIGLRKSGGEWRVMHEHHSGPAVAELGGALGIALLGSLVTVLYRSALSAQDCLAIPERAAPPLQCPASTPSRTNPVRSAQSLTPPVHRQP